MILITIVACNLMLFKPMELGITTSPTRATSWRPATGEQHVMYYIYIYIYVCTHIIMYGSIP